MKHIHQTFFVSFTLKNLNKKNIFYIVVIFNHIAITKLRQLPKKSKEIIVMSLLLTVVSSFVFIKSVLQSGLLFKNKMI